MQNGLVVVWTNTVSRNPSKRNSLMPVLDPTYRKGQVLFWKHHGPLPEGEGYRTYGHHGASARCPRDARSRCCRLPLAVPGGSAVLVVLPSPAGFLGTHPLPSARCSLTASHFHTSVSWLGTLHADTTAGESRICLSAFPHTQCEQRFLQNLFGAQWPRVL